MSAWEACFFIFKRCRFHCFTPLPLCTTTFALDAGGTSAVISHHLTWYMSA